MKKCKRVSIALMLDQPFRGERPNDLHLFRMTGETYSMLYEIARQGGITIEEEYYPREDAALSGGILALFRGGI